MGTEDSKSNTQNINNFSELKINTSYNSSDFYHIESSPSDNTFSKTKTKSEKKFSEKNINNKFPVVFEWNGGGNSVYLSGDFCNWNQLFLMQKNSEGKFILQLEVNKGIIQYKFKVDNIWKINQNFPSILDHGNLNNYIDTTKLDFTPNEKSEVTTDENTESSVKYLDKKIDKNNYGKYYPKYRDMSDSKIAPENYWEIKNNDNKGNNKIERIENEKINHLNIKVKNNNTVSIVCRYRLKFTNFIYYKNG